jgi:hypothetical protein
LYPDSRLSVSEARSWLWGMDLESSNLSSVIVDELRRLGLSRPVDASA